MYDKKQIYYQYFQDKVLPAVKPLEKERVRALRKVVFASVLFFTVGVVFAAAFIYNALFNLFSPFLLPVLLFLMYAFIIKSIIAVIIAAKDYQNKLVEQVLPLFFEPVACFTKWSEKDLEAVLNSKLFGNFDGFEELSCLFGYYNNTGIRISDLRLLLPVKNSAKSYLFRGTMIKLELPKAVDNHVILQSKNMKKFNNFRQFNPKIEDLNRYLYCFAKKTDFDFVTERFWSQVKRLGEVYDAGSFSFSYNDNVVLIALKQKRFMAFGGLFKSLLKPKNYDELIEKFTIVFDLVDLLNG